MRFVVQSRPATFYTNRNFEVPPKMSKCLANNHKIIYFLSLNGAIAGSIPPNI